jgi:3-oxoadipate enol-lactonase
MPFITANGLNLHYEVAGDGWPVIFLHGLGSSADDWALQVPVFAKDYRVVTLDLRAHGQSQFTGSFTIERMADDVGELLTQLRADTSPAHVVALSLGGCVALALALRHPQCVRSLTLVNTFARYRPNGLNGFQQGLMRLWLLQFKTIPALAAWVASSLFPRPEQRQLYEAAVASLGKNSKRTYFESIRAIGRFNIERQLRNIGCPTLIITGDRDATIPLSAKQLLHRSIPNSQLLVIPDSGHATPYDQPEVFNRAVMEFIQKAEGRTP